MKTVIELPQTINTTLHKHKKCYFAIIPLTVCQAENNVFIKKYYPNPTYIIFNNSLNLYQALFQLYNPVIIRDPVQMNLLLKVQHSLAHYIGSNIGDCSTIHTHFTVREHQIIFNNQSKRYSLKDLLEGIPKEYWSKIHSDKIIHYPDSWFVEGNRHNCYFNITRRKLNQAIIGNILQKDEYAIEQFVRRCFLEVSDRIIANGEKDHEDSEKESQICSIVKYTYIYFDKIKSSAVINGRLSETGIITDTHRNELSKQVKTLKHELTYLNLNDHERESLFREKFKLLCKPLFSLGAKYTSDSIKNKSINKISTAINWLLENNINISISHLIFLTNLSRATIYRHLNNINITSISNITLNNLGEKLMNNNIDIIKVVEELRQEIKQLKIEIQDYKIDKHTSTSSELIKLIKTNGNILPYKILLRFCFEHLTIGIIDKKKGNKKKIIRYLESVRDELEQASIFFGSVPNNFKQIVFTTTKELTHNTQSTDIGLYTIRNISSSTSLPTAKQPLPNLQSTAQSINDIGLFDTTQVYWKDNYNSKSALKASLRDYLLDLSFIENNNNIAINSFSYAEDIKSGIDSAKAKLSLFGLYKISNTKETKMDIEKHDVQIIISEFDFNKHLNEHLTPLDAKLYTRKVYDQLKNDPNIIFSYISVSEIGIRFAYALDKPIKTLYEYEHHYLYYSEYLLNKYDVDNILIIDSSQKHNSLFWYEACWYDFYVNWNATVLPNLSSSSSEDTTNIEKANIQPKQELTKESEIIDYEASLPRFVHVVKEKPNNSDNPSLYKLQSAQEINEVLSTKLLTKEEARLHIKKLLIDFYNYKDKHGRKCEYPLTEKTKEKYCGYCEVAGCGKYDQCFDKQYQVDLMKKAIDESITSLQNRCEEGVNVFELKIFVSAEIFKQQSSLTMSDFNNLFTKTSKTSINDVIDIDNELKSIMESNKSYCGISLNDFISKK